VGSDTNAKHTLLLSSLSQTMDVLSKDFGLIVSFKDEV
jgi:hypothetical protein